MSTPHDDRVAADEAFLGFLEGDEPGHLRLPVGPHLVRPDLRLYGGSAVSASVAAAERVTGRDALWMTTQFVSTVTQGHELDVNVEVLAPGRRTNQVRVTGTGPDGVVFASLGATGITGSDLNGTFEHRPEVSGPDPAAAGSSLFGPRSGPVFPEDAPGWHRVVELHPAEIVDHPDPGPGRMAMWMRRRDGGPITPAVAAYMADFVPISVARGLDVAAFGTSLDNTIRVGAFVETEWMLLDLRPHLAFGGYGHGVVHLWSESGHLLATASQTASMRAFADGTAPWSRSD